MVGTPRPSPSSASPHAVATALSAEHTPGARLSAKSSTATSESLHKHLTDKETEVQSGGTCSWDGTKRGNPLYQSACSLYPREPPRTGNGRAPPISRAPPGAPSACGMVSGMCQIAWLTIPAAVCSRDHLFSGQARTSQGPSHGNRRAVGCQNTGTSRVTLG